MPTKSPPRPYAGQVLAEPRIVETLADGGRMEWRLEADGEGGSGWHPVICRRTGEVVERPAWMPLPGSQKAFIDARDVFEVLLHGARGPGKRIKDSDLVLTDSGWKTAGTVAHSDRLVSIDGTYTDIVGIHHQTIGSMYRVTFDDDAVLDVDGDHLWAVRGSKNGGRYVDGWVVRSTAQLVDRMRGSQEWHIPTMTSPAPGVQWTGFDPYAIGLLLGDGSMGGRNATIYTCDDWIRDYMVVIHDWLAYDYPSQNAQMIQSRLPMGGAWKDAVGRYKGADKRVPQALLDADPAARLACLQGLMDSDGSIDSVGRCRFVSLSADLAHGVQYLVRSLGGKAKCYWENRPSPKGGVDGRWRVNVIHCNKFNPFRLPRKAERWKPMTGVYRRIVSIEKMDDAPATCFEVAHPSRLFVCQDFIVTHNTLTLLMDFAQDCGRGHGRAWRGVLFRLEFGDLDDVVAKIDGWFPKIFPGFKFLRSKSDYVAKWETGEELLLRNLPDEEAYKSYHGWEIPWLGFEELTQWSDLRAYKLMMSCCRSSERGVKCRVRATTNPYGPGHNEVKKRFRLPQMDGRIVRVPGELPRMAIGSSTEENFVLLHTTPQYRTNIQQAATSKSQERAWVEGDWTVTAGGMVDDLWDARVHVVPNLPMSKIPGGWRITRAYDHGQSHPFAVGWFLESNGEPAMIDGRSVGGVPGDVVLWQEWYGTTGNPNEGVRMAARNIALGILDREEDLGAQGRVAPGPADTEIYSKDSRGTGRCPADDMEEVGVTWERADKTPGSRVRGWQMLRARLQDALPEADGTRSKPGFFVCERCVHFVELVPPMPRDRRNQDDVPGTYEDHVADMVRYRLNWDVPVAWQRGF